MHRLVSPFILDRYAAGESCGRLDAASLFVDISGFSVMTSALMAHGQHGAEVLATVMRAIFDPLVAAVYGHGGFITVFAGDAFTAVFPAAQDLSGFRRPDRSALAAAWTMREHLRAHPSHTTPYGVFAVAAKIGLAAGEVDWGIIRSEDCTFAQFYFRGPAIDACAHAEGFAAKGDLILHPSVPALLGSQVVAEPVGDHLRVTDVIIPLPEPGPIALPPMAPDILSHFYPHRIIEQTLSGEFRQAINVFIGLQGDPDAAQLEKLVQAVFALQVKYGGFLNRLDFGDKGCSLLLFWGAPVAQENDMVRALDFLLALREGSPVPLRAGVTSRISHAGFIGSALHEEYTCYGNGVNLAARLMTTAAWGSIWVDEPVRLKAERTFEFQPEGRYPFKGFDEAQPVYRLQGTRATGELDFYAYGLVGRQAELSRLADFIQPIFGPQGESRFAGIMVVQGEAGMGKSRLVHDFLVSNANAWQVSETCQVFTCQSDQILRQALNPFRYWLRNYFGVSAAQPGARNRQVFDRKLAELIGATTDQELQRELRRVESFLAALVDLYWDDSLYVRLDPQLRYENTLGALKTLILAESLRQPVILQWEDIHWLDEDSVEFVQRLVRNIEPYPIAVIATARPERDAFFPGSVAYELLELSGLSAMELAALAGDILEGVAAPGLLALLAARASGNPFFAEQILFYLRDGELLAPTPAGWDVRQEALREAPLPSDVRTIFIARLDRLTRQVREVVQTAAVLGREFEVQVLARMLRDEAIQGKIGDAEQAAIWSALSEVRYLFKHVLLRDAAYDMQVRTHRAELHRLAAESLEALYASDPSTGSGRGLAPHYAEIAYHYEAACSLGLAALAQQARAYLTRAGEQAASRYENAAAVDYFTRALALTPEDDPSTGAGQALAMRYDLLLAREAVYHLQGEREAQRQDLDALEALAQARQRPADQAEVAWRRARMIYLTGDYATTIAYAQKTVDWARTAQDMGWEANGQLYRALALRFLGEHAASLEQFAQALPLAHEAGRRDLVAQILYMQGVIAIDQGNYFSGRDLIEQSLVVYREIDNPQGEIWGLTGIGFVAWFLGDFAQAQTYYDQALVICREIGDRHGEGEVVYNLGLPVAAQGDFARARDLHARALQISEDAADRLTRSWALTGMGDVLAALGDLAGAATVLQEAVALRRELGYRQLLMEALAFLGKVRLAQGRPDEARLALVEVLAHLDGGGNFDGTEFHLRNYLSCYQVLDIIGDPRSADLLRSGYTQLQQQVARIQDGEARRAFLENIPWHREIVSAWENTHVPSGDRA